MSVRLFLTLLSIANAIISRSLAADDLNVWFQRNPIPTGDDMRALAFGNGIYILAGGHGAMFTSSDGELWAQQPTTHGESFSDIVFAADAFVATTYGGSIFRSVDGLNWLKVSSGTFLSGVTYGNGLFVAAGGSQFRYSRDGINWVVSAWDFPSGEFSANRVRFLNGLFIVVGSGRQVLTSTDAASWTSRPLSSYRILNDVASKGGVLVAVGSFGAIERSVDAFEWKPVQVEYSGFLYAITSSGENFVAVGYDYGPAVILASTDGWTWTRQETPSPGMLSAITYSGGIFVTAGNPGIIFTSRDATTWAEVSKGIRDDLRGIAFGQGTFVAVGGQGRLISATNTTVWQIIESAVTNMLMNVAYGQGTWVAVGHQGTILTSTNAKQWSSQSLGSDVQLFSIVFARDMFIAVGGVGTMGEPPGAIWSSRDGRAWSLWQLDCTPLCRASAFIDVTYSAQLQAFVAVGWGSGAGSTDGLHWQIIQSSASFSVASGNGHLVLAGEDRIYTATQWNQWKAEYFPSRYDSAVSFTGQDFLLMHANEFFRSNDGTSWQKIEGVRSPLIHRFAQGNGSIIGVGTAGTILESPPASSQIRLLSPRLNAAGEFSVLLQSPARKQVTLERSPDLKTWSPVKYWTNFPLNAETLQPAESNRLYFRSKEF